MDAKIYGVRRRGIFDAVRLPKGFSAAEARNDLLTAYNNGQPIPSTSQLLQTPQNGIYTDSVYGQIDYFAGVLRAGAAAAGALNIGGIFNNGDTPIIVDLVTVTGSGGNSVVNMRFGDFLDIDAEGAGLTDAKNKLTGIDKKQNGLQRNGIFRYRQNTAVDPGRIIKTFYFGRLSDSTLVAYSNSGRDEFRINPKTGLYLDCTLVTGAGGPTADFEFEWREISQNNAPYNAPAVVVTY